MHSSSPRQIFLSGVLRDRFLPSNADITLHVRYVQTATLISLLDHLVRA